LADALLGFVLRQLEQFPHATFLGRELRKLNEEDFDWLCSQRWLCRVASQPARQIFPCPTGSSCEAPGREIVSSQGRYWAVCNCPAGELPVEICLEDLCSYTFDSAAFAQALSVKTKLRGHVAKLSDRLLLVGEYDQAGHAIAVVLAFLDQRSESVATLTSILSQLPSRYSAVVVVTPSYMPHPTDSANLERAGVFVSSGVGSYALVLPALTLPAFVNRAGALGEGIESQKYENVFRRCGGQWQVRFRGSEMFPVLPWLGASYIHHLISAAPTPCSAIDIVCKSAIETSEYVMAAKQAAEVGLTSVANPMLSGIGPISDWEAIKSYRAELIELRDLIDEARSENNNVLEQQYENDLAMVSAKINEAMGLGRKLRMAKDKRKNIRDSFRNAVHRVIDKQIEPVSVALADHLRKAIIFGNQPRYVGDVEIVWETNPMIDLQK
jgi:hypothetical protein